MGDGRGLEESEEGDRRAWWEGEGRQSSVLFYSTEEGLAGCTGHDTNNTKGREKTKYRTTIRYLSNQCTEGFDSGQGSMDGQESIKAIAKRSKRFGQVVEPKKAFEYWWWWFKIKRCVMWLGSGYRWQWQSDMTEWCDKWPSLVT